MILNKVIGIEKNLLLIKREIIKISRETISFENILKIQELYREYLKLEVQIERNLPKSNNGYFSCHTNCYAYALDLPLPFFLEDICNNKFQFKNFLVIQNVGFISKTREKIKYGIMNEKEFLECVFQDLNYLNIKYYDSSLEEKLHHGGYKIGLFYDEKMCNGQPNYHFVRQDKEGIWSCKMGYTNGLHFSRDIDDFKRYYQNRVNLKLIKTLEIVKPRVK